MTCESSDGEDAKSIPVAKRAVSPMICLSYQEPAEKSLLWLFTESMHHQGYSRCNPWCAFIFLVFHSSLSQPQMATRERRRPVRPQSEKEMTGWDIDTFRRGAV